MTAPEEIRSHIWPTSEQNIKVADNVIAPFIIDNLIVGHTYRVSVYVNVDNPTTDAMCQLRTASGYSPVISASGSVTYDFTATSTIHGISVTSSGCDRIRILNGVCVDTADWDTLTSLNLPDNFFNYATQPE